MKESEQSASVPETGKGQKLNKTKLMLLAGFLLIMFLGAGGFFWLKRQQGPSSKIPTVEVNGQKVPATFLTPEFRLQPGQPQTDNSQQAEDLESKIANGSVSYTDYVSLGNIYLRMNNKPKAIENYEKAKQAADPKMESYQAFIQSMDAVIKKLKESS